MKQIIFIPAFALVTALSALAQQTKHNEETVAQLQAEMASGKLNSVSLTNFYINRILTLDQKGGVNSVIELNPAALTMAKNADKLRAQGTVLGPLHGIPILLKDNIDTGDKMQTAAGSFAPWPASPRGPNGRRTAARWWRRHPRQDQPL
jgi:amidase